MPARYFETTEAAILAFVNNVTIFKNPNPKENFWTS
jgi:hypothetical protein